MPTKEMPSLPTPSFDLKSVNQTLNRSILFLLFFLGLTMPLIFLPTLTEPFEMGKKLLLVIASSILILLWCSKTFLTQSFKITLHPLLIPLFILSVVYILSASFSNNPTESFMGRGTVIPLLFVFHLAITSLAPAKESTSKVPLQNWSRFALLGLVTSTIIASISIILQELGLIELSSITNIDVPLDLPVLFSGSFVTQVTLSLPLLVGVTTLIFKVKRRNLKTLLFISLLLILSGFSLSLYYLLPGKETSFKNLPFSAAWNIAVATLQRSKTAFLGYGPEAFVDAFTRLKPAFFNLSSLWETRFAASFNEPLHLMATVGVFGPIAWIGLLISLINLPSSSKNLHLKLATITSLLLQLLVVANTLHWFVTIFLLSLFIIDLKKESSSAVKNITLKPSTAKVLALPLAGLIIFLLYLTSIAYAAAAYHQYALKLAASGNAKLTYEYQQKAIETNPNLDYYHLSYANTNLAVAINAVQDKENAAKNTEQISTLIQQTIREAKAATALNIARTNNWEALAAIYRSLIKITAQADQWTLAAYAQAIQTDPTNPKLRVEIGQVFQSLGQDDQAIRFFQHAIDLKPNWPNGYFNLAKLYKDKKENESALAYFKEAQKYTPKDSDEYFQIQTEIDSLDPSMNGVEQEVNMPLPTPTPTISISPISLPDDLAPEASTSGNLQPTTTPSVASPSATPQ